jgi:hypothetical protein
MCLSGEHATTLIDATEEAVSEQRHGSIEQIHEPGREHKKNSKAAPESRQLGGDPKDRGAPQKDTLLLISNPHENHAVEIVGNHSMASPQLRSRVTLEWRKAEALLDIPVQHPLDRPIAEPAITIIEEQEVRNRAHDVPARRVLRRPDLRRCRGDSGSTCSVSHIACTKGICSSSSSRVHLIASMS